MSLSRWWKWFAPRSWVEGSILKNVVGGGKDGSSYRADGLLGATSGADAEVLRLEVTFLGARGGPGALDQGGLEPGCTLFHEVGPALAGTFIVPWTEPRPGDQMARGLESAHVDAYLPKPALRLPDD